MIRPLLEYADVVWDGCFDNLCDLLESVQYEFAKLVTGAMKGTARQRFLEQLGWEDLKTRHSVHKLVLFFKIVNKMTPSYLFDLLTPTTQEGSGLLLRSANNFSLIPC